MHKLTTKEKQFISAMKDTCKRHNMSIEFEGSINLSKYSEENMNWKVQKEQKC